MGRLAPSLGCLHDGFCSKPQLKDLQSFTNDENSVPSSLSGVRGLHGSSKDSTYAGINMTTLPLETLFSQDAPSPGAAAVATRAPFGTDPSGNEAFLVIAQSLSHTGSFGWSVASGE